MLFVMSLFPQARKTKLILDRIKADIHTCSNFIQQPRMLKENFIKLHKEYIKDGESRLAQVNTHTEPDLHTHSPAYLYV